MKTRIAAFLAALLAGPAMAQEAPICGDFTGIRKALSDKLHMVEVAGGFVDEHTVVVILANPEGKWASFSLDPSGIACLGARGEGWFQARIPAPGERPA